MPFALGIFNLCNGDGVNDEIDHCKDVTGLKTNHGCPENQQAENPKVIPNITEEMVKTVDEVSGKILFGQGRYELTPESLKALNTVADLLKNNPTLRLKIEGYASSEGEHYTNLGVSNARANAVRDYLVSAGIDKKRLSVSYYGADKFLTLVPSKQGLNRRVELKLYY